MALEVEIIQSLNEIEASHWNALGEADYPFTRHEFLVALENHNCLQEFGWQSAHFLVRDADRVVAALPAYIKYNSYGELVFDHSWAQAYERSGQPYYPKLVSAIPYTPATGPRFLIHHEIEETNIRDELQTLLIRVVQQFCISQKLSGWHLLFPREILAKSLKSKPQLLYRYDCQYHWQNRDYRDFNHFLSQLSSRKRKNIRKERESVTSEDLDIIQRYGDELDSAQWQRVHQLYASIFDRKYGTPTLSQSFFEQLGRTMGKRVWLVMVEKAQEIIAFSLFFISDSTLYGRVWGCDEYYNHLHFECCYYQGIDFAIQQGLSHFDPGAQGEHKISRGFLPTRTCSAHWLADEQFHQMIAHYLQQEEAHINAYCAQQAERSPYRRDRH